MDQRNVDFWAYAQGFVRTVDLERLMGVTDPFFLPFFEDLLNERPRKVLDWHSPNETMNQLLR